MELLGHASGEVSAVRKVQDNTCGQDMRTGVSLQQALAHSL